MAQNFNQFYTYLAEKFNEENISKINAEVSLTLTPLNMIDAIKVLQEDEMLAFDQLIDICGVDYPKDNKRFHVIYHFLSLKHNHRLRLKVFLLENESVPSITHIYPSANWWEREAFDMYGILFTDHPNLSRILTDYNFQGYPLRKDFPLWGHVESRYSHEEGRIIQEVVKLPEAYRSFQFESDWKGVKDAFQRNTMNLKQD